MTSEMPEILYGSITWPFRMILKKMLKIFLVVVIRLRLRGPSKLMVAYMKRFPITELAFMLKIWMKTPGFWNRANAEVI